MGLIRIGPPAELVLGLKVPYGVRHFVETGTFYGGTAYWASQHFERVVTIERSQRLHQKAAERYRHIQNIEFLYGDSRELLEEIVPKLGSPSLLWLDAHWCGESTCGEADECPLLEEIAMVNRSKFDNFIFIDDARLFLSPPPPPHRMEHWPDIAAVIGALQLGERGRYMVICEDVIIVVPDFAREIVAKYSRAVNERAWKEHRSPGFRKGLKLIYSHAIKFVGRSLGVLFAASDGHKPSTRQLWGMPHVVSRQGEGHPCRVNVTGGALMEQAQKGSEDLAAARVLVIMPSIPVQGMERANLQIMKMMRERGANILFVTERTYGGKVQREVEQIGCSWTTASFTRTFDERLHLTKSLREMAGVLRAWGRAAWEIDRIYRDYKPTHIYVTNLTYFLYALPTLWRARRPVIFRLPNPPDINIGKKKKLYDWIWRYCVLPVCDVIVCNSRHTLSQAEKIGVNTEKARVIYNCVPERKCPRESDAPRVKPHHFNIAYLGRIRPTKGVRELFEAAVRLVHERDDVDFYLVGEYQWKNPFAEALIKEVRAKNLELRIHFTGEIEDVFGLLSRCDLHVCPSMSEEPFGLVVLEAKSQSVPSVVFPSGGLRETVTHLVDGFMCREKSAQALYEGIRYFLDNPAALKAAGEAAKQSLERFSRERIADQWESIFKNDL